MEYFTKACIAIMVILTAVFGAYLFFKIKRAVETRILLSRTPRGSSLPYNLLRLNFPKKSVFRRLCLPYNPLDRGSKFFCADLAVINRGGILLIKVMDLRGSIENPFRGDWRQFYNQNITQLNNPIEEYGRYARAVCDLLKYESLPNIPIRAAVCYLDGKTRFKNRIGQVFSADKLITYVGDMSKNRFLGAIELSEVLRVVGARKKTLKKASDTSSNLPPAPGDRPGPKK